MNWILMFEVIGIVCGVWILICIGVCTTLKKRIPHGAWHWKIYEFAYKDSPPLTTSRYLRRLIFAPIVVITYYIGLVLLVCCMSTYFLTLDWLVQPIYFGKIIIDWEKSDYWEGIIGMHETKLGVWRPTPRYNTFFPFLPLVWIIGLICTLIYHIDDIAQFLLPLSIDGMQYIQNANTEDYFLCGFALIYILITLNKDRINRWLEKLNNKISRPLEGPEKTIE